jgi:hypothetical protein
VSTGRVGGQTSFRTAKDAGVTFKLNKKERRRLAQARRVFEALRNVKTLTGERDMTPRLVKR